jgi:release factor glutamine methyltransferase
LGSDLRTVLHLALERLKNKSGSPQLDAEILLSHLLSKSRIWIYSNFDLVLDDLTVDKYMKMIEERKKGRPVFYITGKKAFINFEFKINDRVLIPRPETEELVERVVEDSKSTGWKTFLDFGCGSGVIAVSIAKLLPESMVWIVDQNNDALKLTRENAIKMGVSDRIHLLETAERQTFDVVISNPPYLTESEWNRLTDLHEEPRDALVGGKDGNDVYAQIMKTYNADRFYFEIAHPFRTSLKKLFDDEGFRYEIIKDLSGRDRIAILHRC